MTITINGTDGITTPEVTLDNTSADGGQVVLKSSGYSNWNLDNYSGRIRAYYGSTEYFTINSSGNVGIGTSSPATKLNIGSGGVFRLNRTDNGTYGDISYVAGTGFLLNDANSDGYTYQQGGTTKLRIDSSGNLLVGKTSNGSGNIGVELIPSGQIGSTMSASTNATITNYVYSTGAGAFRFYVGMAGTVYATSTTITGISDQRLKENIRDLDDGLDKILALKPRKFDWKENKGKGIANDRGFIAQEFEQVFPDMIEEWQDPAPEGEEPYKAVNANLIPTLVKAIQEQQLIIQTLTARIEALENK